MILLWRILTGERVPRISGLEFLREFLSREPVRQPGSVFWVMANEKSAACNLNWLKTQGIEIDPADWCIAPFYDQAISDPDLAKRIQAGKYPHVVITIGGGSQEQLGWYLKQHLKPVPAIFCIGAAIAFLSGDQVHIPIWADKLWLGWLFRCLSKPNTYLPRYWAARKLAALMYRYRDRLPTKDELILDSSNTAS